MQILKDDIRKKVLAAAREEFLSAGFKNASMRTIAKNANVGLSNIYNYFKNKDEIFREVLSPLLMTLDNIIDEHNRNDHVTLEVFTSQEYMRKQIDMFVSLIKGFKLELKLLLFQAHGSELENYRDDYTDKHTELGVEYIRLMKKKYPTINSDISRFFIHTISSWWMAIIGEIVSHDLDDGTMETFISEYMIFGTGGWKKLMNA